MRRITATLLGAALALASGAAAAQMQQNEVSVFGTLDDISEPEDIESTTIHLRYGRYLSSQALATLGVSRNSFEGSGLDFTNTAITVGAKYYFGVQQERAILPFAEAAVGWAHTDTGADDGTDFTWEFGGGAAYFLSEVTSIDGSIRWYQTDTETRTEGMRFFVGLTTRF